MLNSLKTIVNKLMDKNNKFVNHVFPIFLTYPKKMMIQQLLANKQLCTQILIVQLLHKNTNLRLCKINVCHLSELLNLYVLTVKFGLLDIKIKIVV